MFFFGIGAAERTFACQRRHVRFLLLCRYLFYPVVLAHLERAPREREKRPSRRSLAQFLFPFTAEVSWKI